MSDRYTASGSQAEYEPGSNYRVLRNRLGITCPATMDDSELELLEQLYEAVLVEEFPDRRLTVGDLQHWHYKWLGNIYPWAGEQRSVNVAKDDFHFAAAAQIPRLLTTFQIECLDRYTPAHGLTTRALIEALAVTHVELVLVHPFREGNGRLSRLLADVMSVQAGHDPLDYDSWDARKPEYFSAIQHGMAEDYQPMMRLMADVMYE